MSIAELRAQSAPVTDKLALTESDPSSGLAMRLEGVSAQYGSGRRSLLDRREHSRVAIEDITLNIEAGKITAIIGPSGCGKSTLLRCLNRLHGEGKPEDKISGKITMEVGGKEQDILSPDTDTTLLRRHVGMILQRPTPFNGTILDNAVAGLGLSGQGKRGKERDEIAERVLKQVGLWEEVKTRLNQKATSLSGGQQQRLCIARALAVNPKILLMDEPCASLDPIATAKIEELITKLKNDGLTIIIVTHNLQQAARISDNTAFLSIDSTGGPGKLVEHGPTRDVFRNPQNKRTEDYITGKVG